MNGITERKSRKKAAYIWGAAQNGKYALEYCKDGFNIEAFVDRRADSMFNEFCSKPVMPPENLVCMAEDDKDIIIAVRYPAEAVEFISQIKYSGDIYIFDGRNRETPLLYKVENGEICVPEYMNKRFGEWIEYAEHYSKLNPFVLKMFCTAVDWIREYQNNIEICEIGCGSGQFANMLFDSGYTKYSGVDFSSQAIELAKKANRDYADKFFCEDAFTYLQLRKNENGKLFIMFEVLEHINRDLELLDMFPCGSKIIFSVPNFKSFNHIRTFDNLAAIQSRYKMLKISDCIQLPASKNNDKIYCLVKATKIK